MKIPLNCTRVERNVRKIAGNLNFRIVRKRNPAYDFLAYTYLKYTVMKERVSMDSFQCFIVCTSDFLKHVLHFLSQCFPMRTPRFLSGMGKYYLF